LEPEIAQRKQYWSREYGGLFADECFGWVVELSGKSTQINGEGSDANWLHLAGSCFSN